MRTKILQSLLVAVGLCLAVTGCGQVTSSVSSFNSNSNRSTPGYEPPAAQADSANFISAVRGIMARYVPTAVASSAGMPTDETTLGKVKNTIVELSSENTVQSSTGFSIQAIEDNIPQFAYWNGQASTKKQNNITQEIEHKYRYHLKGHTGTAAEDFIQAYVGDFNKNNLWESYDYIEDYQIIDIYLDSAPDKKFLTLWYHNKIEYDKATNTYTYSLINDNFARAFYVNFVDHTTSQPVTMNITSFDVIVKNNSLDINSKIALKHLGSNNVAVIQLADPQYTTDFHTTSSLSDSNKMVTMKYINDHIETKYYVGRGYSSMEVITGGIEDYATIELYNPNYSNFIIESAANIPTNGRLQYITIQAAAGKTVTLTGTTLFKDVDHLTISSNIIIKGRSNFSTPNCIDVQDHSIKDRHTIYNGNNTAGTAGAGSYPITDDVTYNNFKNLTLTNLSFTDNSEITNIIETASEKTALFINGSTLDNVRIANIDGKNRGIHFDSTGSKIAVLKNTIIQNISSGTNSAIRFQNGGDLQNVTINTVNGKTYGVWLENSSTLTNVNFKDIKSASETALVINGSTLINVLMDNINGKVRGIHFDLSGSKMAVLKNTIIQNVISGSEAGIRFQNGGDLQNVTISAVNGKTHGVFFEKKSGLENTIIQNITSGVHVGVQFENGSNLKNVTINAVNANSYGVQFDGSSTYTLENVVFSNVTGNITYGVYMPGGNTTLKNVVFNNIYGPSYGVSIHSASLENVIFENVKNIYLGSDVGKKFKGTITFRNCSFNGGWTPDKTWSGGAYNSKNGSYTGSKTFN